MERRKTFIIGGGASLKPHLDMLKELHKYGTVIGIKDTVFHVPCTVGLNMDREWFEHRYKLLPLDGQPFWLREGCTRNVGNDADFHIFHGLTYTNELAEVPGMLNGAHSGMKAVNFAYHLGLNQDVYCLGFDMGPQPNGDAYWYPWYEYHPTQKLSGKYKTWATQFGRAEAQCALRQIDLWNVNLVKSIPDMMHMGFKEFEKCLQQP